MVALTSWFLATLVSTLVSAAAIHPGAGIGKSHDVVFSSMTWRGNITVDGPIHEFNGTVQEIHSQILKANPDFKLLDVSHKDSVKTHQLEITNIDCNEPRDNNWGYAIGNEIQDGINYLRGLTGECSQTPGPCGRISCSWNSAISWCWDNPTGSYTTQCSVLADYAQAVFDNCPYRPNEVWGQAYDSAGFSVWCAGKDHLC
ncbi:hypothetical protein PG990_014394 [Apiospora arundinis]